MLNAECGMERATGLEHLTMLDIAPPEFVSLAAGAGFDAVSLRIAPVTPREEAWPLGPGSPMLAQTVRRSVEAPSAPARAELGPARYAARAWRTLDELLR
jgi:hypothetical protein